MEETHIILQSAKLSSLFNSALLEEAIENYLFKAFTL